ncbi:hypothetical protein Rhal01_02424 [Rubritalea halochordaticola]|uniref:Uncharacterized protein n=1 Tax=Rubritalea halochordaticola TaxID=714537 RepID=A0ABP9V0M7_9BACT
MKLLLSVVTLFSIWLISSSNIQAQKNLDIPGSPNGVLGTELLQCRTYCRSMERQLEQLKKDFPALRAEILVAESSWKASPLASGCDAIEESIIKEMGAAKARAILKKLDSMVFKETQDLTKIKTADHARIYIDLVKRRAKGEIEHDMVRAHLLWHHKPYRLHPEEEMTAGYSQQIVHTANTANKISFKVPMSWKPLESQAKNLVAFRNCYGRGTVWMTALVSEYRNAAGEKITAKKAFETLTEESLSTTYKQMGIELTSFTKTKVNGMPAVLFTRKQLHEQLGDRSTRAAIVLRVFADDNFINFQINTLGAEGTAVAERRITIYEPLFKQIGGSLMIADK